MIYRMSCIEFYYYFYECYKTFVTFSKLLRAKVKLFILLIAQKRLSIKPKCVSHIFMILKNSESNNFTIANYYF